MKEKIILFIFLLAASLGGQARADDSSLVSGLSLSLEKQTALAKFIEENRRVAFQHMARKHVGIEILIAGSTTSQIASVFGHSLIRLIDEDGNPLNDTIIGFEMMGLGKGDDMIKGLKGGYETIPRVMDMATFLVRYGLNEGRSLERIVLPSTPETIARLKKAILNVLSVPDIVGDYTFFGNNCLTVLRNVLGFAGYPTPNGIIDVPTGFPGALQSAMVTYAPPIEMPSVYDVLWTRVCDYWQKKQGPGSCRLRLFTAEMLLNSWSDPILRTVLKDDAFWKFLENGSASENSLLVHLWPYGLDTDPNSKESVSMEIMNRLQVLKENTPGFLPVADLFKSLPAAAYRMCGLQDATCRHERLQAALTVWDKNTLARQTAYYFKDARAELKRAELLIPKGKTAMESWLHSEIVQDMVQVSEDLKSY